MNSLDARRSSAASPPAVRKGSAFPGLAPITFWRLCRPSPGGAM